MKIDYDRSVDAAYISLTAGEPIAVPVTVYSCDYEAVGGEINLNFDISGRLVGIEIQQASKKLLKSLIERT